MSGLECSFALVQNADNSEWSADAFAIGLRLGLSLLNNNVCRGRAEKG